MTHRVAAAPRPRMPITTRGATPSADAPGAIAEPPVRPARTRPATSAVRAALMALVVTATTISPLPVLAAAPTNKVAGLEIDDAWLRLITVARPAAGYFTLRNTGAEDHALTSASSPACAHVMLHQSLHDGGQERMVEVAKLKVPAHGSLRFAPGGYHLMCVRPDVNLRPGTSIEMTLGFADGGTLEAPFKVTGPTGK